MKQHFSILMLLSRSTLYKLLLLFILMITAEILLFRQALDNAVLSSQPDFGVRVGLEQVFENSHITLVFGICFLIQTAILSITGCEFGSKQGYTLRRLRISERSLFLWQSAYNAGCYFILWCIQMLLALLLCHLYTTRMDASLISNQTVFLAFYRSDFLHSLLPLENTMRWVRNFILLSGLGISAAAFPYRQRRNGIGLEIILLSALTFFWFPDEVNLLAMDGLFILATIGLSVLAIHYVFIKERRLLYEE